MNNYFKIHKQKNVYKEYNKTESHLKGGIIGLKSKSYSRITNNQIESLRKDIVRLTKRNCKILIRIDMNYSTTKKSIGSRMGKGVGNFDKYVCYLKKGSIILEFFYSTLMSKIYFKKILMTISKKLGVLSSIFEKNIKGIS